MSTLFLAVPLVLLALLLSGLRIAQEYERGVLFRLGQYLREHSPGRKPVAEAA